MHDAAPSRDPYRIGVVGVGHWATNFDRAMDGDLSFYSAVDVAPIDDKRDTLAALDIPESRYTRIDPGDPLPESFLGDVDVVHVASPIAAHRDQSIQALEDSDALVVTEKAYGPALDDHDAVQDVASRQDNDTYIHLHYTRKMPTIALRDTIGDEVDEHGPVQDVSMSFLEGYREEDVDRNWIFDPANGGIVLDWIHPMEVLVYAAGAGFDGLKTGSGVRTTEAYDVDHPTGAELRYGVSGDSFADGATADVRLGKGFPGDMPHKAARFTFDDGTALDVSYASSFDEDGSPDRGALARRDGDGFEVVSLDGPTPYELMADDMVAALEDGDVPFTLDEGREMMDAVRMANDHLFADHTTTFDSDAVVESMVADAFGDTWVRDTAIH